MSGQAISALLSVGSFGTGKEGRNQEIEKEGWNNPSPLLNSETSLRHFVIEPANPFVSMLFPFRPRN